MAKEDSITLKEASDISGYSADYIGQLIRQGKLPGKKVYSNVAWVTTRKDIDKYMQKISARSEDGVVDRVSEKSSQFGRLVLQNIDPTRIYHNLVKFSIFASVVLLVVVFYILSNAIDNRIEQRAMQSVNVELFRK